MEGKLNGYRALYQWLVDAVAHLIHIINVYCIGFWRILHSRLAHYQDRNSIRHKNMVDGIGHHSVYVVVLSMQTNRRKVEWFLSTAFMVS